jgi:hypothetical protein
VAAEPLDVAGLTRRIAALVAQLLKHYAVSARAEAERDLRRVIAGGGALALAVVLLAHSVAFGHAAAVAGLVAAGLPVFPVLLGILAMDLLGALLAALVARLLIVQPVLKETRAQIGELQNMVHLVTG